MPYPLAIILAVAVGIAGRAAEPFRPPRRQIPGPRRLRPVGRWPGIARARIASQGRPGGTGLGRGRASRLEGRQVRPWAVRRRSAFAHRLQRGPAGRERAGPGRRHPERPQGRRGLSGRHGRRRAMAAGRAPRGRQGHALAGRGRGVCPLDPAGRHQDAGRCASATRPTPATGRPPAGSAGFGCSNPDLPTSPLNRSPRPLPATTVSAKLVDESNNGTWGAWDNGPNGAAAPISKDRPEFISLTWPKAVKLAGVCLLWVGFADAEVEAFTGGQGENIREAPDSRWRTVGRLADMDSLYPMALGPHWLAFDTPVETRALRLRVTKGAKSGHSHLADKVKEGRRVWLGELMAVSALPDDADLASLALPQVAAEPPPIPIRFTLPEAGVVTLVIEDSKGRRVRNLVSETPVPGRRERRLLGRLRRHPARPAGGPARRLPRPGAVRRSRQLFRARAVAPAAEAALRVQRLQRRQTRLGDDRQDWLLADHAHAADEHGLRARL